MSAISYVETKHVLVQVENLKKMYGNKVILEGLNLKINDLQLLDRKESQIVSILGPSGVGKTTFLNTLAGLVSADTGSILIDNPLILPSDQTTTEDLIPTRRGLVGVVYQNYRLFPFKTVEQLCQMVYSDNTLIGRKNPSKNEQKDIIHQHLEYFGLLEHSKKYPRHLSGGQRQRVAIVQQLLREPQLLLMDEPFSGLDPETKSKIIAHLTNIAKINEYLTIIIISHDISAALTVSDTVYFMGMNRDAAGKLTYGASIQHDLTMDLKQMGLAWHENDPAKLRELAELRIKADALFPRLSGKS